ncbi:aspartate/glutamate racemase family protein [Kiloniella laminariae]|uniref:Glutamate racemase n=1 Tax=Kiloniella laminariae TaxID=454162 RepID=A0ABT4LEG3_9PROT|nr:aspartate/glutamate racemase family protein [Kiloniella laminariae]MCZ4279491.1 aspartate/glutamate racemase family protein [Kiloniella laminariae]
MTSKEEIQIGTGNCDDPVQVGQAPIGVFDSGSGGLTVLQALRSSLPERDFIYLGDHARAPYGPKSGPEIYDMTREGVDFLFNQGCRLVILACNTASAIALRKLQQEWLPSRAPDNRILGVLVPMVEAITDRPWIRWEQHPQQDLEGTVAIFATEATVRSQTYVVEINKRAPRLKIVQQACPALVPAIEGREGPEALRNLVTGYVSQLLEQSPELPSWIMLGCTHYPLLKELFDDAAKGLTGKQIPLLCQASISADSLGDYLHRHSHLASLQHSIKPEDNHPAARLLYTTGDPKVIATATEVFLPVSATENGQQENWQQALLS